MHRVLLVYLEVGGELRVYDLDLGLEEFELLAKNHGKYVNSGAQLYREADLANFLETLVSEVFPVYRDGQTAGYVNVVPCRDQKLIVIGSLS